MFSEKKKCQEKEPSDNPILAIGSMSDQDLNSFCTGNCAQNLIDYMGNMLNCMPKDKVPVDLPSLNDMATAIGSLCAQNFAGEYCASEFFKLDDAMSSDGILEPDSCRSLTNMGCCLGSAVDTMKTMEAGLAETLSGELTQKCSSKVPLACPLPGSSISGVTVKFDLQGVKGADVVGIDSGNQDTVKDIIAQTIAANAGVDRTDVEIKFDVNAADPTVTTVTAVITPSDQTKVDTISAQADLQNGVNMTDVTTALAGTAAQPEGEVTTGESTTTKETKTNNQVPLSDPVMTTSEASGVSAFSFFVATLAFAMV